MKKILKKPKNGSPFCRKQKEGSYNKDKNDG